MRRVAREQGLADPVPDGLGERELVRQADLRRLCRLAEEFDDGTKTVADWQQWLKARFQHGAQGGVHLLTLHRAKGLEFEAVFIPRVEEKELPCKQALRVPGAIDEERRLLYVGMTRAKRHLALTWSGKPSRFLLELGVEAAPPDRREAGRGARRPDLRRPQGMAPEALEARRGPGLRRLPQLDAGRDRRAPSADDRRAATVPGVGPAKLERYGASCSRPSAA